MSRSIACASSIGQWWSLRWDQVNVLRPENQGEDLSNKGYFGSVWGYRTQVYRLSLHVAGTLRRVLSKGPLPCMMTSPLNTTDTSHNIILCESPHKTPPMLWAPHGHNPTHTYLTLPIVNAQTTLWKLIHTLSAKWPFPNQWLCWARVWSLWLVPHESRPLKRSAVKSF